MATPEAPSIGAPRPTPTLGGGGTFTVSCSTRIAASPTACLDVIVNSAEYPTWNRFCRHCTIDAQPPGVSPDDERLRLGTHFTFDVHADPSAPDDADSKLTGRPTPLEVSVLEAIDEDGDGDDGDGDGDDEGREGRKRTTTTTRRKGWRIAWRQRPTLLMPVWMLRAERVQELVAAGAPPGGEDRAEATEYYCWETFHGPLAPLVKLVAGKMVERGFEAWMQGLKEKAEEGAGPGTG